MKRFVLIMAACATFLLSGYSHALQYTTLRGPNSDHVTYANGLWWYPDMPSMTNMTYEQQLAHIDHLNSTNYGGISSWRMASERDYMHRPGLWINGTRASDYMTPVYTKALTTPEGEIWTILYWEGRT